jgi:hypothetical protein
MGKWNLDSSAVTRRIKQIDTLRSAGRPQAARGGRRVANYFVSRDCKSLALSIVKILKALES